MKQHITEEQYNELTEAQKDIWYRGMIKNGHYMILPDYDTGNKILKDFPSIGEMIEYLNEHNPIWYQDIYTIETETDYRGDNDHHYILQDYAGELCDALWDMVKRELNS